MTTRVWFAITAVCAMAVAAAQDAEPARPEHSGALHCLALKPVENPDAIVQGGQIVCVDKKKGPVAIPIGQVTEIVYDFTSVSNAKRQSEHPMDYFSPEGGILGLSTLVIGPLVAKGMNSILRPHHLVFINWTNGEESATAVFRVQERAVGSFLERLSQLTGKEYRDRFLDAVELPVGVLCLAPTIESLQAIITRDYLRCVDVSGRTVDVHRADIRHVVFDEVKLSDAVGFASYPDRGDSEALGKPLRFAAEHVPHQRLHYAFVYWLDKDRSRVAVYRLSEELRPGFLSRLREIGLDWEDAVAARERLRVESAATRESLRAEAERVPKSSRAQIYVDRQIRVGAYTIGPGHFEFVILESETGLDRLLIEDLSLVSSWRRLVVPAHLIPTNDHWSQGDLVYEDADAPVPEVLEIRFPMQKIRPIS